MTFRFLLILVFCSCCASFAVAQAPPFSSSEKEIALGRNLAGRLETEFGLLDDAAVVGFVQKLAGEISRAAGVEGSITVSILDSAEAQSHSFPGGFLLVRSGLLARTETTAELAGVLAHEVAHIVSRHGMRDASGGLGLTDDVPMIFLGGSAGTCLRMSPGEAVPLARLPATVQNEEEADTLALAYLDKAGYDPRGLIDAYDLLAAGATGERPRLTDGVRERARPYSTGGRSYVSSSSEFVEIRARVSQWLTYERFASVPSLLRGSER